MSYEGEANSKAMSAASEDNLDTRLNNNNTNNNSPSSPMKSGKIQQVIHTNGNDSDNSKRKIKQPRKTTNRQQQKIEKPNDQFEDIPNTHQQRQQHNNNNNQFNQQEDEIVIPDHLISQVHTNSSKEKDQKRLSTITTSSYTKKNKKNLVGPWKLGRTLGRGATGRVRLAKHQKTGQLAAVKIIPKSTFKDNGREAGLSNGIEREIIIMKLISHPNIMALYDVWENKGELYLILEYVERGELFNYLVKHIRLEEREAVHYFKQIIAGVNYCHSFNICHRDLKPENLLLDRNHNIKIADFGMAALEVTNKMLNTSCGSPHYASPEVVTGESYHGGPSDIWSCGIILFALLTGHLPFDDERMTNLLAKVRSGIFRIPSYISLEARDLIKKMLTVNPKKRITIEEILNHPLLQKYPDPPNLSKKNKNYMDSPLPKDIMKKPILEVDKEISRNLQTLWHGEQKSKIIERLQTTDENAEKLFYYLLLKYRQEHSENLNLALKAKNKKKQVLQTANGDTTARDLIKDKKLTMTKSKSIVSTTITDENGNKVTQISKEPLSKAAKLRSTSYKKLANSKYSLHKLENSTSRNNNLNNSTNHNNSSNNKRKTRDIDGNLVISASSSHRKGISFHNRTNSTKSFKSFKNSSPYNSVYNIKNYQGLDAAVAGDTNKIESKNDNNNDEVEDDDEDELDKENNESYVNKDYNFNKAVADAKSNKIMSKSTSKRDSFNAFSMGSIPNYAAMIDQFGLPASSSGKSLSSPKKKQRKSLSGSTSMLATTSSNSIKRLSTVRSRSKRSIMNNSISRKNIRYPKKKSTNVPELPKLNKDENDNEENLDGSERRKSSITSSTHKKVLSSGDFTTGLSNADFAFFCEHVFGFRKGDDNISSSEKFVDLEKEYLRRIEAQRNEEQARESERLAAVERANELSARVKMMVKKAEELELENKRLLQQQQESAKEKEHRNNSLVTETKISRHGTPEKLQRRAINEFADEIYSNSNPNSPRSSPLKSRLGKSPKKKKSVLGVNSNLLNSPGVSNDGSPKKKDVKNGLATLPSQMTTLTNTTTTTTTNDEDKYQDALESMGRQYTNTSSTFSFNFVGNNNKRNSIISTGSSTSKTIFAFSGNGLATPRSPQIIEDPKQPNNPIKNGLFNAPSSNDFNFKTQPSALMKTNTNNSSNGRPIFSRNYIKSPSPPQSADSAKTITSPTANKISLVPQRDAPKAPQSKGLNSKTTKTTKSVIAKGNHLIVKANATTTTTTNNNTNEENANDSKFSIGTDSSPAAFSSPIASPTTATTSTVAMGLINDKDDNLINDNGDQATITKNSSSEDASKASIARAKLSNIEGTTTSSTGTSPMVDSVIDTESKASKAPSINTTTGSSIMTNPKTKQSWFSKVINNFVPSSGSTTSNVSDDDLKIETFLVVDDVQTLIRNSLALRLKEGSVSKVKFDSNSISAVVPAKLAGSRSLKVKIVISPMKGARGGGGDYIINPQGQKILSSRKKTLVVVSKEKGPSKAFSKMGEAIQFTVHTEETQFRTRETRLMGANR